MADTFETKEKIPADITPEELKDLIAIRESGGAVCKQVGDELVCVWKVIAVRKPS